MYIDGSNIEILDLLQKEYSYFNLRIKTLIESKELPLSELLNSRDIYNEIAKDLLGAVELNGLISFPSVDHIKNNENLINNLFQLIYLYEKIQDNQNLLKIGDLEIAIQPNYIQLIGDSPIENSTNLVYNLISLKILLDYKRISFGIN